MTTGKLTKLIEKIKYPKDEPRDYIGASSIGSDCYRQIWYELKGEKASPIPNKIRRTWEIGKILEGMIIGLLQDCGLTISASQHEFIHPDLPYFKGHCDGMIVDYSALLEVKTAKDASFKIFVKQGLKKWNAKYYAQLQSYMGMSSIKVAYIIVLNKDTSETWDEEIKFDPDFYQSLSDKARAIYESPMPPPRVNGSPLWFACKMCKFREVCHG